MRRYCYTCRSLGEECPDCRRSVVESLRKKHGLPSVVFGRRKTVEDDDDDGDSAELLSPAIQRVVVDGNIFTGRPASRPLASGSGGGGRGSRRSPSASPPLTQEPEDYMLGYAALWNVEYLDPVTGRHEVVVPGAFRSVLLSGRPLPVLIKHEGDMKLATTADGTARIWEDDIGLAVACRLGGDMWGKYAQGALRNGLHAEMSIGFAQSGSHSVDRALQPRVYQKVNLCEVSLTRRGASWGTVAISALYPVTPPDVELGGHRGQVKGRAFRALMAYRANLLREGW